MSDPLNDLAQIVEEVLKKMRQLAEGRIADRKATAVSYAEMHRQLLAAHDLLDSERQSRLLNDQLQSALLAELVKAKLVDGGAVAERFLADVRAAHPLFPPHSVALAKHIAEQLSHPGFPDALPKPQAPGPTLVVDND